MTVLLIIALILIGFSTLFLIIDHQGNGDEVFFPKNN